MDDLQLTVDTTGFPMIYVEPVGFYIHWLPVTKIQLEYFLCSTKLSTYDERWYSEIRHHNERTSPGLISSENYWQAIVTGILPREGRDVAAWMGKAYDLPTQTEWLNAYDELKRRGADDQYIDQILQKLDLKTRVQTLLKNINHSLKDINFNPRGGRTLADQMLMRMGVMEYVYQDATRGKYAGFGQTFGRFFGSFESPDNRHPQRLNAPEEGTRMRHYGFRLIQRKKV